MRRLTGSLEKLIRRRASPDGNILLRLTVDEALVLFDFASRFSDTDRLEIVDQAEERALWNLCCRFERQLVQPFQGDYGEQLAAARDRLRDADD